MRPDLIDRETGEVLTLPPPARIVLSQSTVKRLDNDNLCPRFYYLYDLTGMFQEPPSEAMIKGQLFEYLAVNSPNREGQIPQLPKLKNGNKSTDELRIEAQAQVFKDVLPHYGMKVVLPEGADNPSAAVNWDHNEDVLLTGIFDAVILWDGVPAIMDLKLTGSLVSRWGPNGKPGWGDYFNMDHIQAYLYMYLAEKIFKRKMRFVYALFEYGPDPKFKFLEIKDSSMHRQQMMQRLDEARDKLLEMKQQGYPRQGHYRQCSRCVEKDTCPARKLVPEIDVFD